MDRIRRAALTLVLMVLCGCQGGGSVGLKKNDSSGAVLIGLETLPAQDQDYELVLSGFDRVNNKPLGVFSGTRRGLGKGGMMHADPLCIENVCYLQSTLSPGDYVLLNLLVSNKPSIFGKDGKGGLLGGTGRLMTKKDMTKGSYMFHIEPGKITYAGTYVVYADMDAVDMTFAGTQTADSHPGEHGEAEPTVTLKMDIDGAKRALAALKDVNGEMIAPEPTPVTFVW